MQQWPIWEREPKDDYGDPLPPSRDYVDTDVPEEWHTEAQAMRYCEPWHTTVDAVLDMDYLTFTRRALLWKAVNMRRPTKTQHHKIMRNTFGGRY